MRWLQVALAPVIGLAVAALGLAAVLAFAFACAWLVENVIGETRAQMLVLGALLLWGLVVVLVAGWSCAGKLLRWFSPEAPHA